jgi:Ca2+-binding EF-hand superfamily protein
MLTEQILVEIYSQFFSCGDCKLYAKHLFSALLQNTNKYRDSTNSNEHINFQDFIINLSITVRGSLDERIRWLFTFYDLNRNGKITREVSKHFINLRFNNTKLI